MFKITCFATVSPENLGAALKGFQFKKIKDGFKWEVDGYIFKIEPFKNQPRSSLNGFRVYFDGSMEGGIYLFDMVMGWTEPVITGIEYIVQHEKRTPEDWINELVGRNSIQTIDTRGIFKKGRVNLVVVNEGVNLQIRSSKGKKLKLIESLKEVDKIREEIEPVDFDLFSILEEGEAV